MIRIEAFVLAASQLTGAFDTPESVAFKNKNPILLRTYKPEKKVDSEHVRVFSSIRGGFQSAIGDVTSKCSGQSHRLSPENTLKDLLVVYGFNTDSAHRKVILFLRRSLGDNTVELSNKLSWLMEEPKTEEVSECQ